MEHQETPITAADIQAAIDGQQFILYYQPKIDCETLILRGFEALCRWDHPERGLIYPDVFIPVAEQVGLIGKITEVVVDQAFRWYRTTSGVNGLTLSINISAKRLSDLDFADWLRKKCVSFGLRTDLVILEISELGVLSERLNAFDMFSRLQTKGFKVSIDGYGIGHSPLPTLARLPFTEVKIDKSYAMTASQSEHSRAFLRSTIQQSHNLNLKVVAEGVEDKETLEFLRQVRCDYVHGYLVTQPMTGPQTADWILNRRNLMRHIFV